ncbi:MAG TPA: hypothetical protein VJ043_00785 [Candidatus Paceibacterota bacterium]|nr:hypothetical protein [Candidatus Paceibacterota bacterium]
MVWYESVSDNTCMRIASLLLQGFPLEQFEYKGFVPIREIEQILKSRPIPLVLKYDAFFDTAIENVVAFARLKLEFPLHL